jgi:hypothetical protein
MIHIPQIAIKEKPQSPFYDRKTIMETFGICPSTLHKWMNEDGLKFYKINKRVYFKRTDFNEWLEQFKMEK